MTLRTTAVRCRRPTLPHALVAFLLSAPALAAGPVTFSLHFPNPGRHLAAVQATYPGQGETLELAMPVWTPGYYKVQDFVENLLDFTVTGPDGKALPVTRPQPNRWRVETRGARSVRVRYRVVADGGSVTSDWVGRGYAVLNGAATFPQVAGNPKQTYEVRIELRRGWTGAASALARVEGGNARDIRFRARSYDELVDSPIVAGKLAVRRFTVDGVVHEVVDAGDYRRWNGAAEARDLEKMVRTERAFWGELPFRRFVFLNVFRKGAGGLEHADSTLLTSSPSGRNTYGPTPRWMAYVTHEYFHAWNVKRLRPLELSVLDYEKAPVTSGLWVAEGLTTYYGELLACRGGFLTPDGFRDWMSKQIARLQGSPGRLVQSLADASRTVWSTPTSGLARDTNAKTVSYYNKGPIVGFLLDARIQQATKGRRSLDDVMRLAFARYSGERGYSEADFFRTAGDVAGIDLTGWLHHAVDEPGELDYRGALDWYGLRFTKGEGDQAWYLEPRPDASAAQKARWRRLTGAHASGS